MATKWNQIFERGMVTRIKNTGVPINNWYALQNLIDNKYEAGHSKF